MGPKHPLHVENAKLGNAVPAGGTAPPPTVPGNAGSGMTSIPAGTITFTREGLESKLSTFERGSTDPNAGTIADAVRALFLN